MKQEGVTILAIETSCDETAAAVATAAPEDVKTKRPHLLSNIVASQIDIHAATGGVVPEVAARAHVEAITPTIEQALKPLISDLGTISEGLVSKVRELEKLEKTNLLTREGGKPERPNLLTSAKRDDLSRVFDAIDAIAVTTGPGLIGSLLIGIETAKTLAYVFGKPIVPINHLEGHIYANFVREKLDVSTLEVRSDKKFSNLLTSEGGQPERPNKSRRRRDDLTSVHFPALVLIVSGGHTELVLMKDHLTYELVGQTRDDAAGECFDKTARLLGLPYPGGPALSKLAESGDPNSFDFPRPMIDADNFDFSFSGLKTAVYYTLKKLDVGTPSNVLTSEGNKPERPNQAERSEADLTPALRADLAASVQAAIIDVLVAKTIAAAKHYNAKTVMISGGVAANRLLRKHMEKAVMKDLPNALYRQPNLDLATDNAGMIAIAGLYRFLNKNYKNWYDVGVDASASLV